jgi:hypothetical protein
MDESLTWFENGVALFETGDYRGAIAGFDKALALNPNMSEAWNNRGLALIHLEKYQEALVSFDRALYINPRHENAKKARAFVVDRIGGQGTRENSPPAQASGAGSGNPSPVPKTPMPGETGKIRNPALAAIFSFFFPGWGQWYCGRTWDGLKIYGAILVVWILAFILNSLLVSSGSPSWYAAIGMIYLLLYIVIWIYGMYDAYRTAGKINRGELEFSRKSRLFWIPAILLIIVVAIIILAVISAAAFGIAASQSTPSSNSDGKIAVAEITNDDTDHLVIAYVGGPSRDDVRKMTVRVTDINGNTQTKSIDSGPTTPLVPGSAITFYGTFSGRDHDRVVATGTFSDGTERVMVV